LALTDEIAHCDRQVQEFVKGGNNMRIKDIFGSGFSRHDDSYESGRGGWGHGGGDWGGHGGDWGGHGGGWGGHGGGWGREASWGGWGGC
jgi:hypothetical protein